MKKIAIIQYNYQDFYNDDFYSSKAVVESITDWTEVTDEEYKILKNGMRHVNGKYYAVIERPENEPQFVKETVKSYLDKIKKLEKARVDAQKRHEAKAQEAKEKRERKQFEKLKAKFEAEQNEKRT